MICAAYKYIRNLGLPFFGVILTSKFDPHDVFIPKQTPHGSHFPKSSLLLHRRCPKSGAKADLVLAPQGFQPQKNRAWKLDKNPPWN